MELDKPCQTNYINFTIRNVGENPANVWKRIMNVNTNGGDSSFCSVASSEPEFVEGGGTFDAAGTCDSADYVEDDNLAAYMIYDMYICHGVINTTDCPVIDSTNPASSAPDLTSGYWITIIPESDQVRIDNVNGMWIKLDDELAKGGALAVSQSYHLMAWDDAGVETITNWAQGDVMTFDIELEARQLSALAPLSLNAGTLQLENKDPITWEAITGDGIKGTLTYETADAEFKYDFSAIGLQDTTNYSLIYYADGWPGNNPGALITTFTTDGSGDIALTSGSTELGMDLPHVNDANHPIGAKIWLVPSDGYSSTTKSIIGWNHSEYLFEMNLIQYDDIDI